MKSYSDMTVISDPRSMCTHQPGVVLKQALVYSADYDSVHTVLKALSSLSINSTCVHLATLRVWRWHVVTRGRVDIPRRNKYLPYI